MKDLIFLVHAGATLFLVGMIWTVQIVHYPLFAGVGADGYAGYQKLHMSRITPVVAPVMLAELVTAGYFVFAAYRDAPSGLFWFGFALVLLIWASTLFVQAPLHGRLARAFDPTLINKLVWTNWIRTVAWTMRGALVLWLIRGQMK